MQSNDERMLTVGGIHGLERQLTTVMKQWAHWSLSVGFWHLDVVMEWVLAGSRFWRQWSCSLCSTSMQRLYQPIHEIH
jgi:hypothetical protein